jgi:hypothetical protein
MTRLGFVLLLCVLPCLAHGGSAQQPTVTFDFGAGKPQVYTYTSEEVETLTRLLVEVNRQRAEGSRSPVEPWTLEDWQLFIIRNTLSSYETEVKVFHAQDGCKAFEANPDHGKKQEALAVFGGRNPCAPARQ